MSYVSQRCALLIALFFSPHVYAAVDTVSIHVDPDKESITLKIEKLQATDDSISVRGDSIFIDLVEAQVAQKIELSKDKTIREIAISTGNRPRLVVRTRHRREKASAIGTATIVTTVDGGMVVRIPRWSSSRNTPYQLGKALDVIPESKESADSKQSTDKNISLKPTSNVLDVGDQSLAQTKSKNRENDKSASPSAPPVKAYVAAPMVAPEDKNPIVSNPSKDAFATASVAKESDDNNSLGISVGILLLLAGGGVLFWRSRQKVLDRPGFNEMNVVATKQLSAKSKIVWLTVSDRNMVVSVGDDGTQLLTQWHGDSLDPLEISDIEAISDVAIDPPSSPPNREAPTINSVIPDAPPIAFTRRLTSTAPPSPPRQASVSTFAKLKNHIRSPMGGYRFQSALAGEQQKQAAQSAKKTRKQSPTVAPIAEKESVNPALAGLMRLRERAPNVSAEVATQDEIADAEWARELLRATRDSVIGEAG